MRRGWLKVVERHETAFLKYFKPNIRFVSLEVEKIRETLSGKFTYFVVDVKNTFLF